MAKSKISNVSTIRFPKLSRRKFSGLAGGCAVSGALSSISRIEAAFPDGAGWAGWKPNYLLASCMYGYARIEEILPEVKKAGCNAIDVWPMVHGSQREQIDELGVEPFLELLRQHDVKLGCFTQYKLGPFGLTDELRIANQLGCRTIVTGARGPKGLAGADLKSAVNQFAQRLRPVIEQAQSNGVQLAIENHGNSLIESPDSIRWLLDACDSPDCDASHLGIALAPYHLPQQPELVAQLVRYCGQRLSVFYAWQHGHGSMKKLPKDEELLQLPGRGPLDFGPIIKTLAEIRYSGWLEVFMHPFPRGLPIVDEVQDVTAEINRSRKYLDSLVVS